MEALVALPGVGRKTANVVLGNAFGKDEGFVVDTHVARLSRRLGFTRQTDPVKIELDLNVLVPKGRRTLGAHLLIFHGRRDLHGPETALRRVSGRSVVPEDRGLNAPAPGPCFAENARPLRGNQFSETPAENPVKNLAEMGQKTRKRRSSSEMHRLLCDSESAVPSMTYADAQIGVQNRRAEKRSRFLFPHVQPTQKTKLKALLARIRARR